MLRGAECVPGREADEEIGASAAAEVKQGHGSGDDSYSKIAPTMVVENSSGKAFSDVLLARL